MKLFKETLAGVTAAITLSGALAFANNPLSTLDDLEQLRKHPAHHRPQRIELLGKITRIEVQLEPTFIAHFFELDQLFGGDFSLRLQFQRLAYNKVRDAYILTLATVASASDPDVREVADAALINIIDVIERYVAPGQFDAFVQQLYSFGEYLSDAMRARLAQHSSPAQNYFPIREFCKGRLLNFQRANQ